MCSLSLGHCRGLQPAGLPVSALTSGFLHRQETILQCKSKQVSPGLNPSLPHQALRLNSIFLAGVIPQSTPLLPLPHGTSHPSSPTLLKRSPHPTSAHAAGSGTSYFLHLECHPFFGSFTNSHLSSKIQTHGHLL